MKLLIENWRKFTENRNILNEEFYYLTDTDYTQPLSSEIINVLASKLPGSTRALSTDSLKASGAEGVVVSLDDKRVIKLFHSIENAAKNLPLVSKNIPETAQVYSTGKIILDQPVVYYRRGSSYTPSETSATKELYYIVMQRVIPDPYIYNYVELAYEKYNRLSNIDFNKLIELYSIDEPLLKERISEIFLDFMNTQQDNLSSAFQNIDDVLMNAGRKQVNILRNQFNVYRKNKTKEFVLMANGRVVTLKGLILNYLDIENDVPYATEFLDFLAQTPSFQKKPKKSFTNNTLIEDLKAIIELVATIRINKQIPWNDIHKEQFGRENISNKLVALDLGVKGGDSFYDAAAEFDKNVSVLSTRGAEVKVIREEVDNEENTDIKVLNVYDFDRTLFFTHGAEEGKAKYELAFGTQYPHKGWFGREESLSDELEIEANKQIRTIYDVLKAEDDSLSIVISNRTFQLKDRLEQFLSDRGYNFDAIILKSGKVSKSERLQEFWENYPSVDKINVFDDMDDSLSQYQQLRNLYSIYREDLDFNIFKVLESDIIEV
jgi:hypothetical protein